MDSDLEKLLQSINDIPYVHEEKIETFSDLDLWNSFSKEKQQELQHLKPLLHINQDSKK
ncbi:MAG: hypothetical protein WD491_14990 [Balneolales bacterium]